MIIFTLGNLFFLLITSLFYLIFDSECFESLIKDKGRFVIDIIATTANIIDIIVCWLQIAP